MAAPRKKTKLAAAAVYSEKTLRKKNATHAPWRLGTNDSPILLHDDENRLFAGIKLETLEFTNNQLRLTGWCLGSPHLTLLCNGVEVATEIRRLRRNDVVDAYSTSSDMDPGFELSANIPTVGTYGLRWYPAANGKTVPTDFLIAANEGSQQPIEHTTCLGSIDRLFDMVLEGWAWDPANPQNHLQVEFVINDVVIGQAPCEVVRQDLRQAGIGDGAYGFRWPLPDAIGSSLASRMRVRIRGTDVNLAGDISATFSRLATTRCFDGQIDFAWPYYVSGVIAPKANPVPDHLEMMVGNEVVAQLAVELDLDVKSNTYGAGKFDWKVPAELVESAVGSVRLRLPDYGVLDLGNSRPTPDISAGTFSVKDNTIFGRVFVDPRSKPMRLPINIYVDGKKAGTVVVSADDGGSARFSFDIPHTFMTGEESSIGVCTELGRTPLRTADGRLESGYRSLATGVVDSWNPPLLIGWAIDYSSSDQPAVVQLYDGEVLIRETTCSVAREDVSRKFARPGTHGFEISVTLSIFAGIAHRLRLKCNGIALSFGTQCKIPPVLGSDALKAIAPSRRIRGRVEQLTTDMVGGWAWDAMNPDAPVDLVIRVDGQAIGTTRANCFSARLRGSGRSGHQQFVYRLPSSLQNGAKRHVTVEEANTRFELPNKVSPISFPLVALPEADGARPSWNYSGNGSSSGIGGGYVRYEPSCSDHAKRSDALPLISMIALNWNGDLMIEDFLASLERNQPSFRYELLIVDHGSTDTSIEIINRYAQRLPIRLIERGANYSFSASNNYAANLANGEYLLFVNNDLIFQHDCVGTMARLLADPDVGIVGARLLEPIKEADGKWSFEAHHEGVQFKIDALPGAGAKYYSPQEIHGVPVELARSTLQMPVVTAALMACRKSDFSAVDGFCEEYFYGLEDVDFCLKITQQLNKKAVCDLNSSAIHNRSATRDSRFAEKQSAKFYTTDIHAKNRSAYIRRFGRQLGRRIIRSLVEGSSYYRRQPLRVTFAVTEADINTAAGDYFTALELGIWLRKKFGWEVFFIKIGSYSIPGTDVLVVMRHDYNIRKVVQGNPGLVTVAWIRNRTDEWSARPEFGDYNIVFASSQKIIDHLRSVAQRDAILFPIATNPERFSPDMEDPAHASDVVFTGSYHGAVRGAVAMLNLDKPDYQFAIYGYNWEKYPPFAPYCRGNIRYDSLGKAYASSKLVIDDSHPVTRDWNSLNSRIFDAIASGKVVITNCVEGARELFGEALPTFAMRNELNALVDQLLDDDEKREALAQSLRNSVLAHHTYAHRADTFKAGLRAFLKDDALRFSIKIGVPRLDELEQWGDYHFALGMKRALERQGHFARIDILPDWEGGLRASDDVVIVLRGLSRYKPQPTAINIMWLISHPDEVSIAEMREYDHVFVASESYAARLSAQLADKVSPLLQCTDPEVFYPDPDESLALPEVLFVGNSRGQRREVVQYALDVGIDFGVYGGGWHGIVPADRVKGDYIPNGELRRYYSTAKLLLNDHWPDMRAEGFISNRIFDAAACGSMLLSDAVDGMQRLFGDAIPTYRSRESFDEAVKGIFRDPESWGALSAKLRATILSAHTFDHRIRDILGTVA